MSKLVVVIDMQNDFIDGSLGSEAAQKIVPKAVAAIEHYSKEADSHIDITFDTHFEDYFDTLEGKLLPVSHCIMGTKGGDLNEDIANAVSSNCSKDRFWCKNKQSFGYNWFSEWDYDSYDEIIIFGLCTDICVVSNALILRSAFRNTPIKCLAYCCAGTTPEAHEAALKVMESCQIEIIREEGKY